MADILTVADLESAKQDDTFHAEVITGKLGGNGADIDFATHARTGQTQTTLPKVLSNVGFSPAGFDFTTGGTLTERDKAIFYQTDGNWYSWGGALPKVVPPASSPASTGGIADNAWNVSTSAFMYRDWEGFTAELLAQAGIVDDGQPDEIGNSQRVDAMRKIFSNVGTVADIAAGRFKAGVIVSVIDRAFAYFTIESGGVADGLSILDAGNGNTAKLLLIDCKIDVRAFGAVGDWDMGTQTGADDTIAIQAAINYRAALGSRRKGGVGVVYIPPGSYRYSKLTLPSSTDFGMTLCGDSAGGTILWADSSYTGEAILCESEFTLFENITFIGALSDQFGSDSTKWRDLLFKGKLAWNYADIDVTFRNCNFNYFKKLTEIYGRGCGFDNCGFGFISILMNIVCDPSTVFFSGSYFNSLETGMRHYTLRSCRTDVVSVVIDITGSGGQKEYINDILIDGCDFAQTDVLIRGSDAIIRGSTVSDCTSIYSFATGVVQVKSADRLNMTGCNWSKHFNTNTQPSGTSQCINSLIRASEYLNNVVVSNCAAYYISGNIIQALAASKAVTIHSNTFKTAWDIPVGSNHFVFYSPHYCEGLNISDNSFTASNVNGLYYLFDPSAQTGVFTKHSGNLSPFTWQDARTRYTPKLLVNGVQTAGSVNSHGRFEITDNRVKVWVMLAGTITETSGNLSVSLPGVTAVIENITLTDTYAGCGSVGNIGGLASAGASMLPFRINPVTQECELWKVSGLVQSRITAAEKTGVVSIYGYFEYKR